MAEKAEPFFGALDDYHEADDERDEYEEDREEEYEYSSYHAESLDLNDLFVPVAASDISFPDPPEPDPPSGSESHDSREADAGPDLALLESEWGRDDLFLGCCSPASGSSVEFSPNSDGPRILDSISGDEQIVAVRSDREDDGGPRRGPEFEWEEVDGRVDVDGSRWDGRHEPLDPEDEEEDEGDSGSVDWEVLFVANNLGRNPLTTAEDDAESYSGDEHEEYVYTSEYEVLFGHLFEHERALKGSPPAAKSIVESLPTVFLMEGDANCAVCKDEFVTEEGAKRLPCNHHYHADCIMPWLGMRNTCPVCRYELPTDDPEYERWKVQGMRRGAAHEEEEQESQVRYDFEILA